MPGTVERDPKPPIGPQMMDSDDRSGTPVALIELARRTGRLWGLTAVDANDVLVEFPLGTLSRQHMGYRRFVQLRSGEYALVGPAQV